jgi:hypothetical protein
MEATEMTAALSAEQRRLIEGYLGTTEEAAGLWTNVVCARDAGVAWERIDWLAEMYGVPEEVVGALLTGLGLIDPDGQSRERLVAEDPWSAFRAIGIDVPRPAPAPQAGLGRASREEVRRPTRDEVRAAYDAAIREIEAVRQTRYLDSGFYRGVADAVFDACYAALEHQSAWVEQRGPAELATTAQLRATKRTQANTVQPRLHVVSAPMGAGKTTFTVAFIVAMTRMHSAFPGMPYGCVFLVDQIPKAEAMYRELARFLPGQVAVWTTDHNADSTEPPKRVRNPAARFYVDELQDYPVLIVTHAFFKGPRGDKARTVIVDGSAAQRAITMVDEQMQDVAIYEVQLSSAEAVREAVQQQGDETVASRLERLSRFMARKVFVPKAVPEASRGKSLEKPVDDGRVWKTAQELAWFTTEEARAYATKNRDRVPDIENVFGFARCMVEDYAFIARQGSTAFGTYFVGYEPQHAIVPGMVLLDATSDIDGVTPLSPWRDHIEVPRGRYDNLTIVHVQSCTDVALPKFLGGAPGRLTYSNWMQQVIRDHMEPGQLGLVVCKKALLDYRNIPGPHPADPGAEQSEENPPFGWHLDGRKLGVSYWGGAGLGSNAWMDAEVVFLFDEFYLPRRTAIAGTQGHQLAPTSKGAIASMTALNSNSPEVDGIWEGHLLRWTKQMAMRGRGRVFDENGICGQQKLVFTGDFERLLLHKDRMFPGAKLTVWRPDDDLSRYKPWRRKLLEVLSRPELPDPVSTKALGQMLGVAWAAVSGDIMGDETEEMLKALGWAYVRRKGPGGSWFQRTDPGHRAEQPGERIAAE